MLADVTHQRLDLAIDSGGHVDGIRGFHTLHPDLVDRPWLDHFLEQLGKRKRVARIRIDGAQRGLPRRNVIGMAAVHAIEVALWRLGNHDTRANAADDRTDVGAELEGDLHTTIAMTEEVQVGHADDVRRVGLLLATK